MQNVFLGIAIVGTAALNFQTPSASTADQLRTAPVITALAMLVLSCWIHRDVIWPLLRARPLPPNK